MVDLRRRREGKEVLRVTIVSGCKNEVLQAGIPPPSALRPPPSVPLSLRPSFSHLAIAQVAVVVEGRVEVEVEDPLRAVPVQVHHPLFLRGGGVLLKEGREGSSRGIRNK